MESETEQILRVYAGACEEGIAQIETCLLELEQHPERNEVLNEAFRLCHTIKGDSRTVGFEGAARLAHVIEEVFERCRSGSWSMDAALVTQLLPAVDALANVIEDALGGRELEGEEFEALIELHREHLGLGGSNQPGERYGDRNPDANLPHRDGDPSAGSLGGGPPGAGDDAPVERRRKSLRVRIDVLDRLLDLTGELAIARSQMGRLIADDSEMSRSALQNAHRDMELLFNELQEEVMRARMVPIGPILRQHRRTVRDLALSVGKRARLEIHGADAELDTTVIEYVRECLGHVIRNAIAHGIEDPEERQRAGKDPYGRIELRARHQGGSIIVEVADDGQGLDTERIVARGRELGLIAPDRPITDEAIAELVFTPGFSTREAATLVSGRGVGMDVVRDRLEALGGSVRIDSRSGEGSTVSLRLPLTLAIIEGFEVAVGKEIYVIPLASVVECVDLRDGGEAWAAGTGVINLRGRPLPYARLRNVLGIDDAPPKREGIVVVHDQGVTAGVAVDALLGESQAVIKPVGKLFRELPGIAGSTILASGEVALILDVPALLEAAFRGQGGGVHETETAAVPH